MFLVTAGRCGYFDYFLSRCELFCIVWGVVELLLELSLKLLLELLFIIMFILYLKLIGSNFTIKK